MLKLGLLTSYNTKCGIAEYSRYLTDAFRRRDDVELTVYGSKNYDSYKVAEDESYVTPTFGVLPWNNHGDHSFDSNTILDDPPDVLHVQYECVLYNQEPFYKCLKDFEGVKAITYHDNCIPPDFPFNEFDLQYSHREDIGVGGGWVIPMGVENRPPVVKTFGLGRSRRALIEEICIRNDWLFEWSFGEGTWLAPEELYKWLRDSDLIVLYYDEAPAAGTSIAARVAQSTRRPLIVSDTTWFKDLEHTTKASSELDLENAMLDVLDTDLVTWDDIAQWHMEDYAALNI